MVVPVIDGGMSTGTLGNGMAYSFVVLDHMDYFHMMCMIIMIFVW